MRGIQVVLVALLALTMLVHCGAESGYRGKGRRVAAVANRGRPLRGPAPGGAENGITGGAVTWAQLEVVAVGVAPCRSRPRTVSPDRVLPDGRRAFARKEHDGPL
jgi:hypothetical protein